MKLIELTKGKQTIVDDHWFESLNQFKWSAWRDPKNGRWYAMRNVRLQNGKRTVQSMHRLIMGNPKGLKVDHKDGDGLFNVEGNLRVATSAQNGSNQGLAKHNTSGFKGVSWANHMQKWRAQIQVDGKHIHLGYFDSPIDAAKAYNEGALKYHKEFAVLNVLPQEAAMAA